MKIITLSDMFGVCSFVEKFIETITINMIKLSYYFLKKG